MRWFMMPSLTGRGMRPMYCHILEGYQVTPHQERIDRYVVTFTVEGYHSSESVPPEGLHGPAIDGGTVFSPAAEADSVDAGLVTATPPADSYDATSPGQVI
jgi:hypothetical protein